MAEIKSFAYVYKAMSVIKFVFMKMKYWKEYINSDFI